MGGCLDPQDFDHLVGTADKKLSQTRLPGAGSVLSAWLDPRGHEHIRYGWCDSGMNYVKFTQVYKFNFKQTPEASGPHIRQHCLDQCSSLLQTYCCGGRWGSGEKGVGKSTPALRLEPGAPVR